MFGFGKSLKDPLADAKTVERWLATFPPNDPLAGGDGVGPVFNATSCVACHYQGGDGRNNDENLREPPRGHPLQFAAGFGGDDVSACSPAVPMVRFFENIIMNLKNLGRLSLIISLNVCNLFILHL